MRKAWKLVGIAALVAVLSLGTAAAVALAQESTGEANSVFDYYERFRTTLAGVLGISVEEYDSAVVQARDQTLDEAVTEGWLTREQADAMAERMENGPDGRLDGMGWGSHGRGAGGTGSRLLAVASETLGMTESELTMALQDGQTIAALAAEKGVDAQAIIDAYIVKVQEDLTQSVADGRTTQEEADAKLEEARTEALERIRATWEGFAKGSARQGHGSGRRPAERKDTDPGATTGGSDL